jgi:microcystin synthetase protein McyA
VLFTSGSTGNPKGVMIEHQSATTLLYWAGETFQPEYLAGVLASTSINFDLSVYELFVPLCHGGQIVLVDNALSLPTLALREAITLINTVPSAITELARIQGIPNSVKVINLAGEPLKNHLAQRLYQQQTIECVYNLYGPSEDTTYSTYALVPKGSNQEVNIGRPIAQTRIYLLDTNHNPTPLGIPGELCIAGAGLARGYLNRPELTAEKFREVELFGKVERLYKTGDWARWLPDGNLEYLGRLDHQVKLRGFRIELGEIEAVLSQHEAVKEAVVVLQKREDNQFLAAYVTINSQSSAVSSESITPLLAEWREQLKQRLPEYMIPTSITVLEQLPLTPNGKIDRQALPDPELTLTNEGYEPPRTSTEQQLTAIWSAVLKRPDIGIHDNFFELGGDSILSIQIVARARQAGLSLKPRDLFQHQTIADLSLVVQPLRALIAEQGLVQGEVPLTPIQSWFLAGDSTEPWHFNQAVLLEVPDDLDPAALRQALAALLRHHDALRLRNSFTSLRKRTSRSIVRS